MNKDFELAIGLVRREDSDLREADRLHSSRVEGFPDYVYVTMESTDDPIVGGISYVVDLREEKVHPRSASVPPRVNCENVRAGRLYET